jgi:hypothetical protein
MRSTASARSRPQADIKPRDRQDRRCGAEADDQEFHRRRGRWSVSSSGNSPSSAKRLRRRPRRSAVVPAGIPAERGPRTGGQVLGVQQEGMAACCEKL